MLSRRSLLLFPLEAGFIQGAWASDFIDSAGRAVRLPDTIKRIIPAGTPAEALLCSLAPDTLAGFIEPWTDIQKQAGTEKVRDLPTISRITRNEGAPDAAAIQELHADIIIDYGAIDARYATLADKIQSATGIPYLVLDGKLTKVPEIARRLGAIMQREERASEITKSAEFALQKLAPVASKASSERVSVYYARGSDGLRAIRTGSSLDEGIALAGGRNVVSIVEGTFSPMSIDEVAALKPTVVVLADPKAAEPGAPLRKALSAETRFLVDPGLPYGWIERPPSLNRLIGALWLASHFYPDEISFPADDARRMSGRLSLGGRDGQDTSDRLCLLRCLRKIDRAGSAPDIFISADLTWMDYLDKGKLIRPGTRRNLLGNVLVLIEPADASASLTIAPGFDLAGAAGDGKVAVCTIASCPGGIYTEEALEKLGMWEKVEPKLAQADNIRDALTLVSRGEAKFGIVYATDSKADPKVKVVGIFPEATHSPIVYPVAIVEASNNPDAARFEAYLSSKAANKVWIEQGFTILSK